MNCSSIHSSVLLSVMYFFEAAPVGSMNKFFFQKTIRSYASWIFLDTSRRFRSPHLMFACSSLTISLTFWCCWLCCALKIIHCSWTCWLTVSDYHFLVFLKEVRRCWFNPRHVNKLRTLQDVHRKLLFSPGMSLVPSALSWLPDGFSWSMLFDIPKYAKLYWLP